MPRAKGFTLIELLLVLAIIGIISAIAIPALLGQRQSARNTRTASQAANISGVLQNAFDMAEKRVQDRTAVDLAALPEATNATAVLGVLLNRAEFARAKNPFTNGNAYLNGAPATAGDVGIIIGVENAMTVANISYIIKNSGGGDDRRLARSPETSLPPT